VVVAAEEDRIQEEATIRDKDIAMKAAEEANTVTAYPLLTH
jgi:hypothetical protein